MNVDANFNELDRDGFTILPDVLSSDEIVAAQRAVQELLDAEEAVARRTGTQTENLRNAHAIVGKHPHFYEFFLNPPVMQVVRGVLGDDARMYDANVRVPMPTGGRDAKKGFQVHVDREDYAVLPFVGGRDAPMARNVVWCLMDFTKENGSTLLWPGSHHSCLVPDPDADASDAVQVEAPAGSAIIWDAAVWHQGGINFSDSPRWTVIAYYQRAWIKGKTDSVRLLPPEAVEKMSDDARRMVGLAPEPSDYSEVKAPSADEIEALTLEEKKVLGFATYCTPRSTTPRPRARSSNPSPSRVGP